MMESIARLSELAKRFLVERPKELERTSGFVQRSTARLDGPTFVQMCALGWMNNGAASYSQLNHVVASLDIHVRNQAIEERFGEASSKLLRQLLEEAAGQLLEGQAVETPLFEHFPGGVFLQDGTVITLPAELKTIWQGSGGSSGSESALRIQGRWEMRCGGLSGLWLQDSRQSERQGPAMDEPYPEHSLRIVDTAYLSYADMRAASQSRRFWITGVKADMLFADKCGHWWNLTDWLRSLPKDQQIADVWVRAGKREQVPVRLIALRLPKEVVGARKKRANRHVERNPKSKGVQQCGRRPKKGSQHQPRKRARKRNKVSARKQEQLEWLLVLTNVEGSALQALQVVALMRLRWQIELLWKLWKQEAKVDTWRSSKPQRILTELYAKLLSLVIEHWITLQGCWSDPRRSLFKARQVLQWTVSWLILAIRGEVAWETVLARMCSSMAANCWTDRRKHSPSTFQQLADPKLCGS
jgi:Transposase DDE domain